MLRCHSSDALCCWEGVNPCAPGSGEALQPAEGEVGDVVGQPADVFGLVPLLRVEAGDDSYRVLRLWSDGFTVEADVVPPLRGLVDLYDGANHLYQCLIIAADAEGGEMRYDFKRSTEAHDRAPLDFYRSPDAPIALLGKD